MLIGFTTLYIDLISSFLSCLYIDSGPITINPLTLRSLFPGNISKFYRYRGGLTSNPPCFESVVWTIFKDFAKISRRQVSQLNTRKDGSRVATCGVVVGSLYE